jgi:hypothetical protein
MQRARELAINTERLVSEAREFVAASRNTRYAILMLRTLHQLERGRHPGNLDPGWKVSP